MSSLYTNLVENMCARNPSLRTLHAFLSSSEVESSPARIVSVKFFPDEPKSMPRDINPSSLAKELQQEFKEDNNLAKGMMGQLLIIENITREIMNELGSSLDIDPMFFAGHVHSDWRGFEAQSPKFCELPSRLQQQSFSTFCYHRSRVFPAIEQADYKLLRQSNIRRKVIVFPPIQGQRLGLVQHCCSVLVIPRWGARCLGIVLTDPPINNTYVSLRGQQQIVIQASSAPLFQGTEDFLPTYVSRQHTTPKTDRSMLEELLHYWNIGQTDNFDPGMLSLGAISYFPLRIIAAEWVNYLAVMCFSLREYDNPRSDQEDSAQDLNRINSALSAISSWPRRVGSSTTSVNKCISFIKRQAHKGSVSNQWTSLLEDYEFLASSLIQHGEQLQAAVPLVTTYLQLAENRRVYVEAKNVSRLTILALVFVPLSFVSGLFSMDPNFGPGGSHFWVYFVVAGPVLGIVLSIAKPPFDIIHKQMGVLMK